jgi:para-aminobenzoate synthetase component I
VSRIFVSFPITDFHKTKLQVLHWVSQFNTCCFLDNNGYQSEQHIYECLIAVGFRSSLQASAGNAFEQLKLFSANQNDWLFGHFGFDLKNEIEQLSSSHSDHIQFPDLYFFVPEIIIELNRSHIRIGLHADEHRHILKLINQTSVAPAGVIKKNISIEQRFTREEYITTVDNLRNHILRGDCYEINFCQEFYSKDARINPVETYSLLNDISPTPFSAFYKLSDKYLLCASPERYLKKTNSDLLMQPMKGTGTRNKKDIVLDNYYKQELFLSPKERSENVMVVDLVRNDLSKVCEEGSVKVNELYGIYSFPQVHQMVSTVSGRSKPGMDWVDMIAATFPMGSMTGAPKKKVLELIEQYEKTKRGLFSGALGYITPNNDFDFNVIIRSILYNQSREYLSYQTGSGITFYSDAQKEFEECLLKAQAIEKVLTQ